MSNRSRSQNYSPSGKALLILALTGALGVGCLAFYVKVEPGAAKIPVALEQPPVTSRPSVEIVSKREVAPTRHESDLVDTEVSLPKIDGNSASLSKSTTAVPSGEDPLKFIAEKCLKEANVEGVQVVSASEVNGIAVLNFDDHIDEGMGSTQEGSFLKALQVAFGQFPNIKQVELQKQNQPISTLGNIELSGPIEVIRGGSSEVPASKSKPIEP